MDHTKQLQALIVVPDVSLKTKLTLPKGTCIDADSIRIKKTTINKDGPTTELLNSGKDYICHFWVSGSILYIETAIYATELKFKIEFDSGYSSFIVIPSINNNPLISSKYSLEIKASNHDKDE